MYVVKPHYLHREIYRVILSEARAEAKSCVRVDGDADAGIDCQRSGVHRRSLADADTSAWATHELVRCVLVSVLLLRLNAHCPFDVSRYVHRHRQTQVGCALALRIRAVTRRSCSDLRVHLFTDSPV